MSEESMKEMEEIYRKYCVPLKKYVVSICRDPDTADDIVSETFYRAIKNIDSFDGISLFGWLCTIAKNIYFNHLKRKDNNNFSLNAEYAVCVADLSNVEDEAIERLQRKKLFECIQKLSETEKEVVSLHIYADLNFAQIGAVFGKSENWARVTFYRCKEKLKGMMSNE